MLPYIEENTVFVIDFYADVIIVALTLMMPMVFGALIGFSILDDRDDNALPAIIVTPLGLEKFMFFRLTMIFLCSIAAFLLFYFPPLLI